MAGGDVLYLKEITAMVTRRAGDDGSNVFAAWRTEVKGPKHQGPVVLRGQQLFPALCQGRRGSLWGDVAAPGLRGELQGTHCHGLAAHVGPAAPSGVGCLRHSLPPWAWWLDHPSPPPCSPLHQSLCDIRTGKEGKRVLPTRWSALFASGKGQLQSPRRMQGTFTKLPALGHSTEPSQQHFEVDIFIPIV